jgi:hypothetical protein
MIYDVIYIVEEGKVTNPRRRLYLCGPMTGLPDFNFPAFHTAAGKLRDLGYTVVNPAEINHPEKRREDCMRDDIRELLSCDVIVTLPGWQGSKGANLEVEVAKAIGLEVADYSEVGPYPEFLQQRQGETQ